MVILSPVYSKASKTAFINEKEGDFLRIYPMMRSVFPRKIESASELLFCWGGESMSQVSEKELEKIVKEGIRIGGDARPNELKILKVERVRKT